MRLLNKRRVDILCDSVEERMKVLQNLIQRGYVWHKGSGVIFGEGFTPERIEQRYPYSSYPVIVAEKGSEGPKIYGSAEIFQKYRITAEKFLKLDGGTEK